MSGPLDSFSAPVRRWFASAFGEPTSPQAAGWPAIQQGDHTLILAPTGSGKTLAAFLWGIDRIYRELGESAERGPGPEGVRLLYVSPLKALNNDIERNLRAPLAGIRAAATAEGTPLPPLRVAVRTGDTPAFARAAMLRQPPHILITTPESLYLILTSPRARDILRSVRTIIVDEIHTLVGEKRGVHLTLSIERLAHLSGGSFQRIGLSATVKPLDEAARFLGGAEWVAGDDGGRVLRPRPVTIVDTGYRKPLDLQVVTAVADFRHLPGNTIWPAVIPQVLGDVLRHRSTLIFANNRRLAERTADRLNAQIAAERSEEVPPGSTEVLAPGGIAIDRGMFAIGAAGPIRAHHGSMAREARREMEEDLKAGRLPALVGTSTLELGIDIGAVDLVVQLQSPKSVSQGLQRVGRSGHLVGQTSKGRIYATYREDLVEAAAVARGMLEGDVEPKRTPLNPLDVLSQQVVAAVSVEEWPGGELFDLCRQAYPYHSLTSLAWESVLKMLSGRFQEFGGPGAPSLAARIVWDRENNRLAALPGSRLLALGNPGVIPDTGVFDVFLADGKTRVGTLDEEFVFETHQGDTFLLGSTVWRVVEMADDKVIVADAAGAVPRMPFWKGDYPWRPFELGVRIGRLRRAVADQIEAHAGDLASVMDWVRAEYALDENSARNLLEYVGRQIDALGVISSDRTIVVESFTDAIGEARMVIHSPFGGRVNGAWSLVLTEAMSERLGFAPETQVNDDGILLRFPGTLQGVDDIGMLPAGVPARAAMPATGGGTPADLVAHMGSDEARERLLRELPNSAVFGAHFRMNAGRALLLPKARGAKRTPFWLQRLKARSLLASVRRIPDFPIIAETYRDCLRDVFDLEHLDALLRDIQTGAVGVVTVETLAPSPLAAGLLYNLISQHMYEWDAPKAEYQLQELTLGRELIEDLLQGATSGHTPLRIEALEELAGRAGRTADGRRARGYDELATLLLEFGDLTAVEAGERSDGEARKWLARLAADGRARAVALRTAGGSEERWLASELASQYVPLLAREPHGDPEAAEPVLRRFLRHAGPITRDGILARYGFDTVWLDQTLAGLIGARELVQGQFTGGPKGELQFCDRHLFEQLYQRSLAILRREVEPVPAEAFTRHLLAWQGVDGGQAGPEGARRAFRTLAGAAQPAVTWERDLLPARVARFRATDADELLSRGEIAWVLAGASGRHARLRFIPRGEGAPFLGPPPDPDEMPSLAGAARAVYDYLRREGASFLTDVRTGLRIPEAEVRASLATLALAGLVTGDSMGALHSILSEQQESAGEPQPFRDPFRGELGPRRTQPTLATRRERAHSLRHKVSARVARQIAGADGWGGRWSAVHRAAAWGNPLAPEEVAAARVTATLARFGVVTRDIIARAESRWEYQDAGEPAAPPVETSWEWGELYPHLHRMELRGEVRRGYFVAGLAGLQFALPEAVEALRRVREPGGDETVVLVATDPAMVLAEESAPVKFARVPSTHVVLVGGQVALIAEDNGERLTPIAADADRLRAALAAYLGRSGGARRITISTWGGAPALGSPAEAMLRSLGASRTPSGLEYWRQ